MVKTDKFNLIGISTETSNKYGQNAKDIGKLWERFFSENLLDRVPNRLSDDIHVIYTDYESNYLGRYTTFIGLKVNALDNVPENLTGRTFQSGYFKKFTAKGNIPNAVLETWEEIWSKDEELNRAYIYDYEVYGEKSQNGDLSEVDIFLSICTSSV